MVRQNFPLPLPEDLLDEMRGSTIFTLIYLKAAYLQLPLLPGDKEKAAIVTPDAPYEFNYLLFGISIASQAMQRTMYLLFEDLLYECVVIVQDDLCIHSKGEETHLLEIREVLSRLARAKLMLTINKSQLLQRSIRYLGHIIHGTTIAPNPKNVSAVLEWETLKSPKQVKQFLGAINFYRKFIPEFSDCSRYLRNLMLSKNLWVWDESSQGEFDD